MPYFSIYNARHRVASFETTTHGTVKAATDKFKWAVGKHAATLNEWLHRHQLRAEQAVGAHYIDLCRLELKPQQELVRQP